MKTLKRLFNEKKVSLLAGAHDAIGASIVEECGFDAVWISGFEMSAMCGVPDTNILSVKEIVWIAQYICESVKIPTLIDGDSGYGDFHNIIHAVKSFEKIGIQGISIEDKAFPKKNSFLNTEHSLLTIEEFSCNISAACSARISNNFLIIARTEELIAGGNVEKALIRCEKYVESGADAIIVHSKENGPDLVINFAQKWNLNVPLIIIPTTFPQLTFKEAENVGINGIIYANQGIRSSVLAMKKVFSQIIQDGTAQKVEENLSSIADIFKIQKMEKYIYDENKFKIDKDKLLI